MVIVVDVNVILIGNEMSDQKCRQHHRNFLTSFAGSNFLALDIGGLVKQLYENRVGSASAGKKWLTMLYVKNRVQHFPLAKIPQAMKAKLDKLHFDWTDSKYIRLAMNTPDRHLVTEDPDFSPAVEKMLRQEAEIEVRSTRSACEHLGIACPD